MTTATHNMLSRVYLFKDLSEDDLNELEKQTTLKRFPKNAILVNEGDETDSLYIIESGKIKIYVGDDEGKELILTLHGPGDYFGEISLLDGAPRSASAMTLEDSKLYIIQKRRFETFLRNDPEVCMRVMRGLTLRLRELTDSVRDLALIDVYGRIAKKLTSMANSEEGKMVISQKLTHKEIAAMIGSSREMVSRIMKELSRGGYIIVEKDRMIINKKMPARW
ncbi:cAMP-binding proteins - catabolite gene activator and regulatory subunit of cAMP-dependent protein kinases [hydrothermal vent metagenome]|uniref:cAMP-binding proteins - catabolite gene activator and regulatory subunit of cAMP-dependent protein kinases n=1 Tax=hydrothermal vent metagenome TaxID=652676 RepID=A0A3B0Z4Q2_9ZZZZ